MTDLSFIDEMFDEKPKKKTPDKFGFVDALVDKARSQGMTVDMSGDLPDPDEIAAASESTQIPGSLERGQKAFLVKTTVENRKLMKRIASETDKQFPGTVPLYPGVKTPVDQAVEKFFGGTMKVIETFQIPQQMLFNSLKRVQSGEMSIDSFVEGISGAVRGKESTSTKQLFDKALDEISNAGYMSPLIRDAIKNNPGYKAIAFAHDVLVDPPFLFGSGITQTGKLSKVARAADEIGTGIKLDSKAADMIAGFYRAKKPTEEMLKEFPRWAETVEGQVDLGQRALVTFLGRPVIRGKGIVKATDAITTKIGRTRMVQGLRNLATTKTGNAAMDEILFRTQQAYNYAQREGVEQGIDIGKRLKDVDQNQINLISKILDEGLDYRVVHDPKLFGKEVQAAGGKKVLGVQEEVAGVLGDMRTEFQFMKDAERANGVLKAELENYFPRVMTKEALDKTREGTVNLLEFNILPKGTVLQAGKERKTAAFTLDEFNALKQKDLGIEEFFTKDPAVAFAIRKQGHLKAMSQAEMWDDVANKFAIKDVSDPAFKGSVVVEGVPRLNGLRFDPEMAGHIKKMNGIINDKTNLTAMYGGWKEVTDWWKAWTLGIFPEYHFRNSVSNFWNNWLAGVDNPAYYMDAYKVTKGAEGSLKTTTGHLWSFDQVRKLAKKYGVEGTGWYGAEVPEYIKQQVKGGVQIPFGTMREKASAIAGRNNPMLKVGFAVGRGIENNARMAHFIYQLKQGKTPVEAAQSVAKYLFDYGDLTRFEKHAKQFLPFMKWTKQNIPLQFVNLFKQPWKYTLVSKGRAAMFEQGETFQQLYPEMPDFIRENTPIRIRQTPEGDHEYFLLGGWWPGASIQQMLNPRDTVTNLMHPAFNYVVNVGQIMEFTSPRAAREYEAEQQEEVKFVGVKMSRNMANRLRAIRLLSSGDRFYKDMKAMQAEQETSATPTRTALKFLTGVKTYKTSPAKDTMYKRVQQRDALRRQLERLKRYKGEE